MIKKASVLLTIILLSSTLAFGQSDKLFDGLCLSYAGLTGVETYQTLKAYDRAQELKDWTMHESNPVARHLLPHKPLLVAFEAGITLSSIYLLKHLRKEHKVIAYIAVIGLNIFKGWAVYHNFKEYQKFPR